MNHLVFTVPLAFALAGSPALALDPELTDVNRTAFDTIDVNGDDNFRIVRSISTVGW